MPAVRLAIQIKEYVPWNKDRQGESVPVASPKSLMDFKVVSISCTKDESCVQEFAFFLQHGP